MVVQSDEWNGEFVQVDGSAEVLDLPDALDGLCDYFRVISGEHPDWDEYRERDDSTRQVPDPADHRAVGPDRQGRIPRPPRHRLTATPPWLDATPHDS